MPSTQTELEDIFSFKMLSLTVYELLRITFLYPIFQTQVSEYREMKIEDDGKIPYTEIDQPRTNWP